MRCGCSICVAFGRHWAMTFTRDGVCGGRVPRRVLARWRVAVRGIVLAAAIEELQDDLGALRF
eukprot:4783485-Pleurochrysis_carterae.AAC.1